MNTTLLSLVAALALVTIPVSAPAAPDPEGKLAARCARLAAAKDKHVMKALRHERLCAAPSVIAPVTAPESDLTDEILDLPPVFTPHPDTETSEGGIGGDEAAVPGIPVADVPEPGSLALLALGLLGLGVLRRRPG